VSRAVRCEPAAFHPNVVTGALRDQFSGTTRVNTTPGTQQCFAEPPRRTWPPTACPRCSEPCQMPRRWQSEPGSGRMAELRAEQRPGQRLARNRPAKSQVVDGSASKGERRAANSGCRGQLSRPRRRDKQISANAPQMAPSRLQAMTRRDPAEWLHFAASERARPTQFHRQRSVEGMAAAPIRCLCEASGKLTEERRRDGERMHGPSTSRV